jgi:RNA polymerase sigma factor (sigma-70 family)
MDQRFPEREFPGDPPRTELQRRVDRGEQPHAILQELCRSMQPRLYRFGCKQLRDVHEAYDLVQRVFVKMQLSFARMIAREPVEAWIFTVAHREVADWYRDSARRVLPAEAEILDRDAAGELRAESFEEQVEEWIGSSRPLLIYLRTMVAVGWIRQKDLDAYWEGMVKEVSQRDLAKEFGVTQGRISQLKSEVGRKARIALYLGDILGTVRAPYREAVIRSHLQLLDMALKLTPRDRELLRYAGAAVRRDVLGQPVLLPKDAEVAIQALPGDPEPTLHDLHDAEVKYPGAIPNPTPRCIESPCAVHTASRT